MSRPGRTVPLVIARTLALAVICATGASLGGCARSGQLTVHSLDDTDIAVEGAFERGVYGYEDRNHVHVVLFEGPVDQPTAALHLNMFWRPRAGRTPVDPRGTNVVVRYIVFDDEQVGVYGGAGFVRADGWRGGRTFTADVRQATLRLLDRTEAFEDELGLAEASGRFTAQRDDAEALRRVRALQTQVSGKLGYPRFVEAQPEPHTTPG